MLVKRIIQISVIALSVLSIVVVISVLFSSNLINEAEGAESGAITASQQNLRYLPNESYGFGEKFEYDVQYGFIKAGEGIMQIMPKPVKIRGRDCYDVRFEVRSLRSLEFLYKVINSYRSIVDVSGIFTWMFEQSIRENKYKYDFQARFDQYNQIAYVDKKQYPVPEYVQDVISAFYYVRTLDLSSMKAGSVINLRNFWKDSTFTLGVRIHNKAVVKVPAGTFKCVIVEPVDMQGGLFRNIGSIMIYLTDDDRKMPVKVSTKILIGEVTAELVRFRGLRGPLNSRVEK